MLCSARELLALTEALREWARDSVSPELREQFLRSRRAVSRWERSHPVALGDVLRWLEQIERLFGPGRPDREPWRGDDFRL